MGRKVRASSDRIGIGFALAGGLVWASLGVASTVQWAEQSRKSPTVRTRSAAMLERHGRGWPEGYPLPFVPYAGAACGLTEPRATAQSRALEALEPRE